MAYRAEIEIGVKGAAKLAAFQKTLKETNKILEVTNKTRDIFEMPLQNIQNYTKNLREADCYILNTCHIREKATDKVYHEVGRVRKEFRNKNKPIVLVAGCVAQA